MVLEINFILDQFFDDNALCFPMNQTSIKILKTLAEELFIYLVHLIFFHNEVFFWMLLFETFEIHITFPPLSYDEIKIYDVQEEEGEKTCSHWYIIY